MPPRSKVALLPEDVRAELERRLIKGGFGGYRELADWLSEQGFEISKSSLHSWGQSFEDRLGALKTVTEQARVIVEESPDDDGALNDALIRLVQERVFTILVDLEIDPAKVDLHKLMRNVATLSRASVYQKRHAAEVRRDALKDAALAAGEAGKNAGLSDDVRARIEKEILGLQR